MKLQVRLLVVFLLAGSQIQAMDSLRWLLDRFTLSGVVAPGDGEGCRSSGDFESDEDEAEPFKEFRPGYYVDQETYGVLQPVLRPEGAVHRQSCAFVFYTQENATAQDQMKEHRSVIRFITECFYRLQDIVLPRYNAILWMDGACNIWVIFHQDKAASTQDGLLKTAQTFWNEFLSEPYFKQRTLSCVGGIGAITFCLAGVTRGLSMFGKVVQDIGESPSFDVPENSILVTPIFLACQPSLSDESKNEMHEGRPYRVLSFEDFGAALNAEA
jgi:hypothetical protein